jgi:hypothetical protein
MRGLSDKSQTISSGKACAYATIVAGEVLSDGCAGQPNGTACVDCLNAAGQFGRVPNSSGGPGIDATGGLIACQNRFKIVGACFNGGCDEMATVDKCQGSPPAYEAQ